MVRSPQLHLFVCANRRDAGSPLGPGCGERGDAVYDALKATVAERRLVAQLWVTKTHCLGICPKRGATVARYSSRRLGQTCPSSDPIRAEVMPADAIAMLDEAVTTSTTPTPAERDPWIAIERELDAIEKLQTKKVLDLARRLKPGLTLEDVQNPHDFPELDDPDWHYADGILAGVKSVATALRALRNREGSARGAGEGSDG
jgi:hypothetical protein